MTETQTLDGVDVHVDVQPDSPANWKRVGPALSALIDLASGLASIDADWSIDITVGGIPITTITAEPTTEQDTAA